MSTFLASVNAPVALVRALLSRFYFGWWSYNVGFVIAIGLFWHWIALNISSWRLYRTARTFVWLPLRIVADAALVIVGGLLGVITADTCGLWAPVFHSRFGGIPLYGSTLSEYVYNTFIVCFWLIWSCGFILLFGRDLHLAILNARFPKACTPPR